MDNINSGKYAETALTAIDSNAKTVCITAWNMLKEKIRNPYLCTGQNVTVDAKLIVRETMAHCRTATVSEVLLQKII